MRTMAAPCSSEYGPTGTEAKVGATGLQFFDILNAFVVIPLRVFTGCLLVEGREPMRYWREAKVTHKSAGAARVG